MRWLCAPSPLPYPKSPQLSDNVPRPAEDLRWRIALPTLIQSASALDRRVLFDRTPRRSSVPASGTQCLSDLRHRSRTSGWQDALANLMDSVSRYCALPLVGAPLANLASRL